MNVDVAAIVMAMSDGSRSHADEVKNISLQLVEKTTS